MIDILVCPCNKYHHIAQPCLGVDKSTQASAMRLNAGQMETQGAGSEGDQDDGGLVAMEAVEESGHKRR